jgi:hypothetical protein
MIPAVIMPSTKKIVLTLAFLLILSMLGWNRTVSALPTPFSEEELTKRSDLIIEGRVTKVWPFDEWLAHIKRETPAPQKEVLLKEIPATSQDIIKILRNFPYKNGPAQVDGVDIAEVEVGKHLKGISTEVIFIPFVRYHFPPGRQLIGAWSERPYQPGQHLKMYLKKNGPFFESTWWNGVQELPQ